MIIKSIIIIFTIQTLAAAFNYCTISPDNTMCKFSPNKTSSACGKVFPMKITAADKATILKVHNDFRRKVAQGKETRGSPGPQPTASNMMELIWDDEIATMAQTHAQQCVFQHDKNRNVQRFSVGQNLAIQISTAPFSQPNWTGMITNWYDEVTVMDKANVAKFPATSSKGVIGHYTQLVWATSRYIGCGIMSYKDSAYRTFYVCNYGPAGNYIGQPIYKTGSAASACPTGSSAKTGLCA